MYVIVRVSSSWHFRILLLAQGGAIYVYENQSILFVKDQEKNGYA